MRSFARTIVVLATAATISGAARNVSSQPALPPIPETALLAGSPLHIVLDGSDPSGGPLHYSVVTSGDPVKATVLSGNRSLRVEVEGFGDMVFQLFDGRAPRATNHVVELADSGFYDGVTFHRVIAGFVIQGGDPTGTGSGGSALGSFDDQFHVQLQHNRTGILSMAKAFDDTNDSQFFIAEGPQRHLDFNHTIFGILVEGEDVRNRISGVAVDANSRPLSPVVMSKVRSFVDEENAVVMLEAPEGATGAADVTVTVRNDRGQEAHQTFRVDVTPDTIDSPPFLADIPEITTALNTPVTYQLEAIDVEGNPAHFLDERTLAANGLAVPVQADPDLHYSVDFDTGVLTITPVNNLAGRHSLTVATAVATTDVDYQVVSVVIGN
jgi:cyclophilin family peptidyl-prolyl cis-trans isomerase